MLLACDPSAMSDGQDASLPIEAISEHGTLRYPCPCCGYIMFDEPPGSYDICDICGWEDDDLQLWWPRFGGGANSPSLMEAQANFARAGYSQEPRLPSSRQPTLSDQREPGWRPIDLALDDFGHEGTREGPAPSDPTTLYWWRPTFWRLHRHDT
jgi:Cysteine-rich CPCC